MFFGSRKKKENFLNALASVGLPADRGWWARYPERALEELWLLQENTHATLSCEGDALVIQEQVITNFGISYYLKILAKDFPFKMPKVYLEHSAIVPDVKFHMYPDGSLCLFHSDEWNSRFSLLKIRNHAASWCFCYEVAQYNDGIWSGAEQSHS